MYHKKTPKSQEAYKSLYVCHNPHTIPLTERKWPDRIRIISVDPGTVSYAIRCEERNLKISDSITTLLFEKIGLKKEEQELTSDNESKIFTFIQTFLDQYIDLFKTCHMVIIEKQLPINYRCVRVSQHTLTYFMVLLKNIVPTLPMFFEVAPTLKGKELGAPPNINEKGLKMWSIEKARELLIIREDKIGLSVLERKVKGKKEKKDDISDSLIQIESLFSYFGWPLTSPVTKPNKVKLNILSNINTNKIKLNIL